MKTSRISILFLILFIFSFSSCSKEEDYQYMLPDQTLDIQHRDLANTLHSDLQPILNLDPRGEEGNYFHFEFLGQIHNIGEVASKGKIQLFMHKDSRLELDISSLDSGAWEYDASHRSFHIWTSDIEIASDAFLDFNVQASYDMKFNSSLANFTLTILTGSGGEINGMNNTAHVMLEF